MALAENELAAVHLGAQASMAASKLEQAQRDAEAASAILELRQVMRWLQSNTICLLCLLDFLRFLCLLSCTLNGALSCLNLTSLASGQLFAGQTRSHHRKP